MGESLNFLERMSVCVLTNSKVHVCVCSRGLTRYTVKAEMKSSPDTSLSYSLPGEKAASP